MFAYSVPLCDLYSAAVSCTENSASCGFLWILLLSLDKTCIKASKVQSCLIIRWRMQSSKLFTLHLVLASLLLLSVPWVGQKASGDYQWPFVSNSALQLDLMKSL